ncbi:tryptophan synthase subunit alpha [Deinococcus peraridilitoris]|uniref:Tryptophan synthase alpha chain n=1 Tax=Deinococcus peraridilitoris (strain DSM 19664 / LMG 22246 / CIP 109416 / KR-200) TaxID=937777 RepID=L0A5J0_DEIPD|nr:tryptophan synthase subunit alpha [Deinococcus peraridilitoris]AFZ69143.1 tryptophan synthase, alpha subunit [Deinococcus peraridilitoris DSM 19664]
MTATQNSAQNRIQSAFDAAQAEGRAAFIGYLPADYPDQAAFQREARTLLAHADLLEIGLPYSDPLGDGPTIQQASEVALRGGATIARTFEAARSLRSVTDKPLVIMTYYNPILAWGEERFVREAVAAGVDGLILPDLPPDEAHELRELAAAHGLRLTFLIAPTSTPERIELVAGATTGFLYAVSVTGVTGARSGSALHEVPAMLELARRFTDKPIAVGFGVADRASAQAVARVADGVVVGSALVTAARQPGGVGELAREIRAGCVRGA